MAQLENKNMRDVVLKTGKSPTQPVDGWKDLLSTVSYLTSAGIWDDGTGAPSATYGLNGQYYHNLTSGDVYRKYNGTWTLVGSLAGGGGGEDLDATLTIGNTTGQSAIFTDGLTNTTTLAPGGLSIDAENLAVNVGNNVLGSVMLQLNTTTGTFILGDATGSVVPVRSPFIYASVPAISISAGGNQDEGFSANSSTHITTAFSSSANGQILFQTGAINSGVDMLLDNGAGTASVRNGDLVISDATANTLVMTPTAIHDGIGRGGIDFSATGGTILFPATGFNIGATTYAETTITTVGLGNFVIASDHHIGLTTLNGGSLFVNLDSTGKFNILTLHDFASNALAIAGGLVTGDLFYTNTAGEATMKIVI